VARVAIAALFVCACAPTPTRAPIAACSDDLRGVYVVDGKRWMILDHRATLEAYPLFDDVHHAAAAAPGLEVAPRAIDLQRTPAMERPAPGADELAGTVTRRYLRGADRCDAQARARVTACSGDTLELVLADPVPPITFAPCAWGQPASSRRERWRRE